MQIQTIRSYRNVRLVALQHMLFMTATALVSYLLVKLIFGDYLFFQDEQRLNSILAVASYFIIVVLIIITWALNYERYVHILFFSFQPFWNRGASYIDFFGLGEFYFLTGQYVILIVYTFFLLSRTYTMSDRSAHLAFLVFSFTGFLLSKLIFVPGDMISVSLQVYHILLVIPFFLIGNYILINLKMEKIGLVCVGYLYILTTVYLIIELMLKAQPIIQDPMLFIRYGLRLGAEHAQSRTIAPLSGGLHDLLYFSFMMSIWPIISQRMVERNLLSNRVMKISSWVSFALVLLVFSKTPIIIALFSMFSVRLVRLRTGSILIFVLVLFILKGYIFNLLDRFGLFFDGLLALIFSDLDAFNAIDSSSASRFKELLYGWHSFSEHPWWGSSEFRIYTSLPITFFYNFGIVIGVIPIILITFYFFRLTHANRIFFVAIGLYSILTFGNLAGVAGWRIPDEAQTLADYIKLYGWVPSFNFGNLLTTYFIVLVMVRSRAKVVANV